ncbi:hypothetical protein E4T42_03631 [Aureobasidium subglaciale]|uniref:Uncharacterized protein n=1 Tax=Aureobasidium subglaciale (strain EXF-2481) TaxID=1043005 RepID=A0A074ZI67_AURSE|nr:uncharacterized protein AUEXF2481DRAFT_36759 [Aureobasidium subglaciale EXF-2481]KAI5219642.1 hypothetical protein E4T41_07866 [Aureobasidium subglaciale]KAI5252215.1 hypothetical protein E4T42_03631 [Aureobasidium subglaciale]KEQ98251.1 hypothetical protein AUEXF2481DRAFT_36759 [Aureobasidium subglaciale EXF-2481]
MFSLLVNKTRPAQTCFFSLRIWSRNSPSASPLSITHACPIFLSHYYDDAESRKEKRREAQRRYKASPAGKAVYAFWRTHMREQYNNNPTFRTARRLDTFVRYIWKTGKLGKFYSWESHVPLVLPAREHHHCTACERTRRLSVCSIHVYCMF